MPRRPLRAPPALASTRPLRPRTRRQTTSRRPFSRASTLPCRTARSSAAVVVAVATAMLTAGETTSGRRLTGARAVTTTITITATGTATTTTTETTTETTAMTGEATTTTTTTTMAAAAAAASAVPRASTSCRIPLSARRPRSGQSASLYRRATTTRVCASMHQKLHRLSLFSRFFPSISPLVLFIFNLSTPSVTVRLRCFNFFFFLF